VYVLKEQMGEGCFGTVHKVRSRMRNRSKGRLFNLVHQNSTYACKTVPITTAEDVQLLKEECSNLEDVRGHPHLLDFEKTFEENSELHIVTELLEGGELYEVIRELQMKQTYFPVDDAAWMIHNILDGLSYCHDVIGIVHRDLKASNFMFKRKIHIPDRSKHNKSIKTRNSQNLRDIKIIDFGLSTKISPQTGKVKGGVGTPYYVAPEVLTEEFYDSKCDVWSAGVIAFLILSNRLPFRGKDEQETIDFLRDAPNHQPKYDSVRWMRMDPQAVNFCNSLLQTDPSKRPTAREAMSHPWIVKHCGPPPPQRKRINRDHSIVLHPVLGDDSIELAPPPLAQSLTANSSQSFDIERTSSKISLMTQMTLNSSQSFDVDTRTSPKIVLMNPITESKRDSSSSKYHKGTLLQRWFSSIRGHRSEVETIDFGTNNNTGGRSRRRSRQKTQNMWVLEA